MTLYPSPAVPGLSNVGSYQKSGKPYVSSSINCTAMTSVQLPSVSKFIQIYNAGTGSLKFGFSQNGVAGTNYFTVAEEASTGVLEVAVIDIWLSGSNSVNIFAGLTNINRTSLIDNYSGSVGVG